MENAKADVTLTDVYKIYPGGELRAPIAAKQIERVKHLVGKASCLGLRPKAFKLKDASAGEDAVVLKGTIEVRELLGEEILAHLHNGDHKFTVSLDPHCKAELDGVLDMCLEMEDAHVFDAESGRNLTVPVGMA